MSPLIEVQLSLESRSYYHDRSKCKLQLNLQRIPSKHYLLQLHKWENKKETYLNYGTLMSKGQPP